MKWIVGCYLIIIWCGLIIDWFVYIWYDIICPFIICKIILNESFDAVWFFEMWMKYVWFMMKWLIYAVCMWWWIFFFFSFFFWWYDEMMFDFYIIDECMNMINAYMMIMVWILWFRKWCFVYDLFLWCEIYELFCFLLCSMNLIIMYM